MDNIFDVLIIGAGPAAVSSAIYSSRKGLKTAMVGVYVGGQVMDTNEIENIIGLPNTNGFEFSQKLDEHLKKNTVEFFRGYNVIKIDKKDEIFISTLENNKDILSKTIILATGAKWKELGIEGEKEFLGKGVHYCSTCDGPFYKNKNVVVVGGGNSGVEAAIDLSNVADKVTLIEYMNELKADKILQNKLYSNPKINVLLSTKTLKIEGNIKANKLKILDMANNEEKDLEMDGLFVEIGLVANTNLVKDLVKVNKLNEVIVDDNNMSSLKGLFAAGDCSNTKYKQIVIAMGEGAKAALSVFDYLLKN